MPPTLDEIDLIARLSNLARNSVAMPYNPFSNEDQPNRWRPNWGPTIQAVLDGLIATEPADYGNTRVNPITLEQVQTNDFNLLSSAITKAAQEARFR